MIYISKNSTIFYGLFLFSFFFLFTKCGQIDSSKKRIKTQENITKIIDALPLNQPDLYLKTIKDSSNNQTEVLGMCMYLLSSGWRQDPHVYDILLKKIDAEYGVKNDTIHCYVLNYVTQNFLRKRKIDSALIVSQEAVLAAEKLKDSLLISNAYQCLGTAYLMNSKLMQSIENMQHAMDYLPAQNMISLADLKADLANVYARQQNYKKAKEVMLESFKFAKIYKDSVSVALYATHLANAYLDLQLGDSVLWAAEQAQTIANEVQDSSVWPLIYYYKAVGYELRREYPKAIDCAKMAIQLSEIKQDLWLKTRATTIMGNAYLGMRDLEKAKLLYEEVWKIQREKMHIKVNSRLCDSMVVLQLQKSGNIELRNLYKRTRAFMDSTFSAREMSIIEEMNVRYETEKKENEIKKLATQKKTAQLQALITALILLLFLGIGSWIIYRNRQQKLLLEKENMLLESSKQLLEINKQLQTKELEENKRELNMFKEMILTKNKLLEEMEIQIMDLLKNSSTIESGQVNENKLALNAMKILTDTDWKKYLDYFEKAKPSFIERVSVQFGNLTQGELRLFLLMNLKFTRQQIADILGISSEGVRKNQYRLKKKLNIPEEVNLEDYVKGF